MPHIHPTFADPLAEHFATIPQHVTPDDDHGLTIEPCESGDAAAVILIPMVLFLGGACVVVQLIRFLSGLVVGGSL
ncbi:hypothetical protein ACH47B_06740 [Rhodococcus sp. NPDC019627]|uniref:hypothetical protein n=1 Tax=unclassified Rhodococcus (in: high G+C Gram-positive bacteria) TaxID=192944 RepID=UPI00378C0265